MFTEHDKNSEVFKLTNIICVIHGTIQTRSKYLLSLAIQYFSKIRSHGGQPEGKGLRLSTYIVTL